jgi:hypothetical protein
VLSPFFKIKILAGIVPDYYLPGGSLHWKKFRPRGNV